MDEGISFMVRIRDEEDTLYESISSLKDLTIPHEIVLILHLCKDKSLEIAQKLQETNKNIRILTYDNEISRPGYEHLATHESSQHSIVTYYNWCLKQTRMPWIFKWDADFVSSVELIEYLNANKWFRDTKLIKFNAKYEDVDHKEYYLISGLLSYVKDTFCEVFMYTQGSTMCNTDIIINHVSKPSTLKSYWRRIPWYQIEDSEEAKLVSERIANLTRDFGKEEVGAVRYGNDNSEIWNLRNKIQRSNLSYL